MTDISNTKDRIDENNQPLPSLVSSIISASINEAEKINEEIEKRFGKDTKEYKLKSLLILYEFIFFFLHYVSRTIFNKTGKANHILLDEVGLTVSGVVSETFFGHWPKEKCEEMRLDFFKKLDVAETEYAKCASSHKKTWIEVTISLLADRLAKIVTGQVNQDAIFLLGMIQSMTAHLFGKRKITDLIQEVLAAQDEGGNCATCRNKITGVHISAAGKDFCSDVCHLRFWKDEMPNLGGRLITDEDISNLDSLVGESRKGEYTRISRFILERFNSTAFMLNLRYGPPSEDKQD